LLQSLDNDLALGEDADAGGFERSPGSRSVVKKKVRNADAVDDPGAAAFDAHTGPAEGFAHISEGAGVIRELDGKVGHESNSKLIGRATCKSLGWAAAENKAARRIVRR
jgi:hypothetical protein